MKQSNTSSSELEVKIKKVVLDVLQSSVAEKNNSHQKGCPCTTLAPKKLPVGVNFLSRKWIKLLTYLVILYWYPLDEIIRPYYYLDLLDLFGESQFYWLEALSTKELFLKYLDSQEWFTEQWFFSAVCNKKNIEDSLSLAVLRFEEKLRIPKRVLRRKGYKDKGSLGNISTRAQRWGVQEDYYLTALQFLREEQEEMHQEDVLALRYYLLGLRTLAGEDLTKFRLQKGEKNESEEYTRISSYIRERASGETSLEKRES